jgi:hypothetical protein
MENVPDTAVLHQLISNDEFPIRVLAWQADDWQADDGMHAVAAG